MLQVFMGSGQRKTNVSAATTDCSGLLQVITQCKKLDVRQDAKSLAEKVRDLLGNGRIQRLYIMVTFRIPVTFEGDPVIIYFFCKSETSLSLVLGGFQTHNLLIFGQTPKPAILPKNMARI